MCHAIPYQYYIYFMCGEMDQLISNQSWNIENNEPIHDNQRKTKSWSQPRQDFIWIICFSLYRYKQLHEQNKHTIHSTKWIKWL